MTTMGKRVKEIRESLKFTQKEFADFFGFSRAFIGAVEKDRSKFSVEHLVKLLVSYDVNINYILAGKGEMFLEPKTITKELDAIIDKKIDEKLKQRGF